MRRAPLLLVAASGLAREVLAAVRTHGTHDVVGFLDDSAELEGSSVAGLPVLGPVAAVADHPDAEILVCAGRGAARSAIVDRLGALGVGRGRFATFVHPGVEVPGGCEVGAGTVLLSGVVLTADVRIGEHVVAMPQVTFTHDDVVEDFATLAAGVSLGGSVRIGRAAYLGMSSCVRERLSIGAGATVGMGAVVLDEVPSGETWAGVPARRLRPADERAGGSRVPTGGSGHNEVSRATADAARRTDRS